MAEAYTTDEQASEILDILAADEPDNDTGPSVDIAPDADEAPAREQADKIAAEDTPPAKTATEAEAEAKATPIEPPVSWDADGKELFKTLPRAAQEKLAKRESERESKFTKTQQEIAEAKKAAEADRTAVQSERQTYAKNLQHVIEMAETMDPILAAGRKKDWAKASAENPIDTQTEWFAYQQRLTQLKQLQDEKDRVDQSMRGDLLKTSNEKLAEKLDFWKDPVQRGVFQSEFRDYVKAHEFSDDELNGLSDHRVIILGRKAMLYDKMIAEQARIVEKRVAAPPQKVMKPQASNDTTTGSARSEALFKRARQTGKLKDQAEAILAVL